MFAKLLIANRGEIACRIIATARRLGIATVAVYSDADADARHVADADEAVRLGPAPAAESYLAGDRILAAAARTGADAIHPGYGFLSEAPDFVAAVEAAGLVFVGPPASAIRAMGLKDAAKARMAAAGVPVVPGYHGTERDPDLLAARAAEIGYPVFIKARAGGGGRGMRHVESPAAFRAALESAEREAEAAFGDPACLIEKAVARPRHIEMQVLADAHGAVVHLFERDCSLQRRHQKVVEEAPAPGMTPKVRAAMGAAAVEAARAIGYRGAGTVEFIVDGTGPLRPDGFWFMEMNTRLQVEHPVTEAVTALDLVELQLRIAAGEPLPMAQDDVAIDGHAVEARLYAEDPRAGFRPASGRLEHLRLPAATAFAPGPLRIDAGVREGDTVSPFYDPMIAKLIAHGATRDAALGRLATALDGVRIAGVATNAAFLAALVRHPAVRAGQVETGLIAHALEALVAAPEPPEEVVAVAAIAALGLLAPPGGADPWDRLAGWRHYSEAWQYALLERDGMALERRVTTSGGGRFTVEGGPAAVELTVEAEAPETLRVTRDGRRSRVHLARTRTALTVFSGGGAFAFGLPDRLRAEEEGDAAGDVLVAPMPGLVRVVAAASGDRVRAGAPLVMLEAMKMEHALAAPRDGVVASVEVAPGDTVSDGAVLLTLEPEARDG